MATRSKLLDLSLSMQIERDRLKAINAELRALLLDATERLEGALESQGETEAEWSISDRKFCATSRAAIKKSEEK